MGTCCRSLFLPGKAASLAPKNMVTPTREVAEPCLEFRTMKKTKRAYYQNKNNGKCHLNKRSQTHPQQTLSSLRLKDSEARAYRTVLVQVILYIIISI